MVGIRFNYKYMHFSLRRLCDSILIDITAFFVMRSTSLRDTLMRTKEVIAPKNNAAEMKINYICFVHSKTKYCIEPISPFSNESRLG